MSQSISPMNNNDDNNNNIMDDDDDEEEEEKQIHIQSFLQSIDENEDDKEEEVEYNEENEQSVKNLNIFLSDDELSILPDPMKISLSLKWIDLKNNKEITNDGVDKLNQIYVKKIEPSRNFVICVEGCSYEPNPNWDLSLL